MLTRYTASALAIAEYEMLPDGEGYLGRIPGFQGILANAPGLAECQAQLTEVLEEWIGTRIRDGLAPHATGDMIGPDPPDDQTRALRNGLSDGAT